MLVLTPFVAKIIPSQPAEETLLKETTDKANDDIEIQTENRNKSIQNMTPISNSLSQPSSQKKKGINPFKIVWRLMKNKVRHQFLYRYERVRIRNFYF